MKKGKRKGIGRRILSVVLSVVLTLGLMPDMPGSKMVVQAAGSEPSVTAYATRDQLMTAFQQDGNNTTIGKIVFGKNYEDNPQEWYILGKDTGVEGDNIVIFAASSIIEKHAFSAGTGDEIGIGDAVYDDDPPDKVYQTHYGISKLRAKLKSIAADTSYFTSAEQKLMQATTIRTRDGRNGGTYTTTDVLYLLDASGDVLEVSYHAGTHNSLTFPYLRYPECWNF